MSQYFPQAIMTLRITFEDFKRGSDSRNAPLKKFAVMAKELSVNINDYMSADSFDCTLDFKNFPFDPRTIRSLGVTIHIEDMKRLATGDQRIQPTTSNIIFSGFADKSTISLNDGTDEVRFQGRDQTALLLDAAWDGSLVNLQGRNVVQVIEGILAGLEATKDLKVQVRGGITNTPQLGSLGIEGENELSNKRSAKKNESYWDVIQDIVSRSGLIAFIEIDKLVITKPQVLYENEETNSKQFIYGHNLESFEMSRKIGRFVDINIQVVSLNPMASPPILKAEIPENATPAFKRRMKLPPTGPIFVNAKVAQASTLGPVSVPVALPAADKDEAGGQLEKAPVIPFRIPTVQNREQLITIGESIFEEMSRQQIDGKITTADMTVRDKRGIEFDCTKIRIATPIDIRIDYQYITGISHTTSYEKRKQYLIDRKYNPEVAANLAKAIGDFGSPFYTKAVTYQFSADGGFKMDLEFINFVRLSPDLLREYTLGPVRVPI